MDILDSIKSKPACERKASVNEYITNVVKPDLKFDFEDCIPLDVSIFKLGFNSLNAIELIHKLQKDLGCSFNTSVLYSHPTLNKLSAHVYESLFEGQTQQQRPTSSLMKIRSSVVALLQKM